MNWPEDWIGIRLSPDLLNLADKWGAARADRAIEERRVFERRPRTEKKSDHISGVRGELAARLYLDLPIPVQDDTYEDDIRRGYDVAGYSVKCRTKAWHDLALSDGDKGPFMLFLEHELPVLWLVGTIGTKEAWQLATSHDGGDNRTGTGFFVVTKKYLHPCAETTAHSTHPLCRVRRRRTMEA
jgi:hypothetical protein